MVEGDDFPTEEEMINQNLTKEQIEQVLLLKKQQHQMALQAAAEGQAPVGDGDEMYDEHQMHQIYAGQRVPKKRKVPKQSLTANFIGNNAKQSQRAKRNTLANR